MGKRGGGWGREGVGGAEREWVGGERKVGKDRLNQPIRLVLYNYPLLAYGCILIFSRILEIFMKCFYERVM